MFSKTYVAGVFLAASSLAFATTAIGTASTRGDMRVDGYAINGNATLFDGTAVQTSQTSATLRLSKGTEIKLGTDSLGTLYHDHLVLQQGKGEVSTSDTFQVDASAFHVIPTSANTRGVVSVNGLGAIEVAAISGEFKVTDVNGLVIAKVTAGKSKSFAMGAGGAGDYKTVTVGSNQGVTGAAIVVLGGAAAIFAIQEGIYHANGASR